MAPIHSVIMLQMPDHGLNRLAALQQPLFRFVQSPFFAAMVDLNARIIVIDAAIPEVDKKWLHSLGQFFFGINKVTALRFQAAIAAPVLVK